MNEFRAFAKETMTGWLAMLRLPADSQAKPVLDTGGREKLFPCELSATKASRDHLIAWLNGRMRGEISVDADDLRHRVFGDSPARIYPGHGRAAVVVETRHRRRA